MENEYQIDFPEKEDQGEWEWDGKQIYIDFPVKEEDKIHPYIDLWERVSAPQRRKTENRE